VRCEMVVSDKLVKVDQDALVSRMIRVNVDIETTLSLR
jgi:hypothetical protein